MAVFQITPTISTGAYSTGDVIGDKMVLKGAAARNGVIIDIVIYDDDNEQDRIDFFFFSGTLSGTYTDNAAFSIDAADKPKFFGAVTIATTDYIAAGSDAVATKLQIPLSIRPNNSGTSDITVIAVIRDTTTFTTTSDLRFEFGILWD